MTLPPTISAFGTVDGELALGGASISRLAERVGATPFFAYDRRLLTGRIELLRRTLPKKISLSYAVKANPMPAVVQHLATLVDSFDVASALEMRTALDTPMRPDKVSFAGPGKTEVEIAQAVAAGVTIEIESPTEAARVVRAGERLGVQPRVAVRVNPDFQVKGSGMRMGGGPQQFGVDAEKVPALVADLGSAGVDFLGFHVFAGSQNLRADILCEAQRKTVDLVLALAEKSPPIRYLNLGGGFGIPYFHGDAPLDVTSVGAALAERLAALPAALASTEFAIELGRYLVGEAGVYLARIVDRKTSHGVVYLVTDGGLHHQLAASGNFGTVVRRNYPAAIATRFDAEPVEEASVVGCLCTPLDRLADQALLPRAEAGDLVAIFCAGAYGATASPAAFLGQGPARERLV